MTVVFVYIAIIMVGLLMMSFWYQLKVLEERNNETKAMLEKYQQVVDEYKKALNIK